MKPFNNSFVSMHPCYRSDQLSNILCKLLNVFLGTLASLTICGNLLVIISIIYFKQLHTPTNCFILSLAVADLLVGAFIFPFNMAFSITSCWYDTTPLCKVQASFDITLSTSSILNLSCISIDRYYAVCQPLIYKSKINTHVAMSMSLGSWIVSILTGILFLFWMMDPEKCAKECFLFGTILPLFSFYFPSTIMLIIYLKIFHVAKKQVNRIKNTTYQRKRSGVTISKMERKATKTLAIVLGIFLICWAPLFLWYEFEPLINSSVPLLEPLNWLGLTNSMLNPFIYAFFYSWFRSAFRMIIFGKIFRGNFTNAKLG